MPGALNTVAIVWLMLSALSAVIVAADVVFAKRQKMMIMNFVWPITALWAGPWGAFVYWQIGRAGDQKGSFWRSVIVGDSHCAAGCTIGDFIGEWIVFSTGFVVAGSVLWADYLLDFCLAYLFGIVFQYFSIAPMRGLSGWQGIKAALKADTISLVAFEIGMFVWMGLVNRTIFHPKLEPTEPAYWLMMQIAMLIGFLTAYPANWWLIKRGLKEAM
jgi:hypothetical protein